MQYHEFIKRVQHHSGFNDSESEQATEVFMETLGARLPDEELKKLCSQLPQEIADMAAPSLGKIEKLHGPEFLERIAARQNIEPEHAKKQLYSVWRTLKEAVSEGQIEHIKSQLPSDLADMLY